MEWGFIWLMFVLKIPIFMLLGLVWYASRAPELEDEISDDGGSHDRPPSPHRPDRRRPRGPHGDPAPLPSPPRVRRMRSRRRRADRLS